jgi:hypothetical protein
MEKSIGQPSPSQNEKRKFWNRFYTNKSYLFSKYAEDYFVRINPMIKFSIGSTQDKDGIIFENVRGVELSGGIDNRFYFYTNIVESQVRFPAYVDRYIESVESIPGNGFYKPYRSSFFDISDGYDFLNSTGYLGVAISDHVSFKFGHGNQFIGNGYRSVLQSDFANNAFFLQLDWKFWKVHYRNLWRELRPESAVFSRSDGQQSRKYAATHHLSLNLTPKLNIGLFETVIFDRSDQLELGYLNPIILFRTVEQSVNSPDNVLLGFDVRWDLLHRYSIYGQLLFDEFKLDELILDNQGWWGNKYALQLGIQALDVFKIKNMDARIEFNSVRPYTYSHRDSSASYSHYNVALAHPMGANFWELVGELKYPISTKMRAKALLIYNKQGLDEEGKNWGGNILLPHATRVMEYDNDIGQGLESTLILGSLQLSYLLFPGCYIDAKYLLRDWKLETSDDISEQVLQLGIRLNMTGETMGI